VLDGAVAIYLPLELVNACNAFRDEEYKIKNLKVGDEALNYYSSLQTIIIGDKD
jgi:hypothetical protein